MQSSLFVHEKKRYYNAGDAISLFSYYKSLVKHQSDKLKVTNFQCLEYIIYKMQPNHILLDDPYKYNLYILYGT